VQLTSHHKNIALYMVKCVAGFVGIALLGEAFDVTDVTWVVISMLLVLSPDSMEVIPLTIVRTKSNLVASLISVVFLFLCPNVTLAIALAIVVTIIACEIFDLMAGSRAALAAVVIVSFHAPGPHLWSTALERVADVVVGCAVALILTFIFHRKLHFRHRIVGKDQQSE
jgi:uncharacterized membrane protein YccC